MKALVLAGGRGKRLGDLSEDVNKCMIEVMGHPLIEYSFNCVADLDVVEEIVVVVGYKAESIINQYGIEYKEKPIKYVIQREQRGLVNAIECSIDTIGDADFMLMLGDELMAKPRHKEFTDFFTNAPDIFGVCGVVTVDDLEHIKKTYSIIKGEDDRIFRLIEKPSKPMNNIMGTGNCLFRNEILSYIEQTPINQKRGEKELPDLIQCAIDDARLIKSFNICDVYVNVNVSEEIANAQSYFTHF